jgi:hypothetical protein
VSLSVCNVKLSLFVLKLDQMDVIPNLWRSLDITHVYLSVFSKDLFVGAL